MERSEYPFKRPEDMTEEERIERISALFSAWLTGEIQDAYTLATTPAPSPRRPVPGDGSGAGE